MVSLFDDDSLLLITYIGEDGKRVFRCRYQEGRTSRLLYEKLGMSSYECILDDFPWDHWIFTDIRDEESFLEAFKWYIIYE